MGWLSNLFGGSSSTPQTLQTSSSTSVPSYVEDYGKSQLSLATALGNREYDPYTGERVAGFTAPQQQGFDLTQSNVGAWQPNLNTSQGVMQNQTSATWPNAPVSDYMNPYTSTMNDSINRAYDMSGNRVSDQAVGAGAFGGARQGVMSAENERNRNTALADVARQGYADAYTKWNADQSRQMGAAQNLGTLTDTQQRLRTADAAALGGMGAQQQGQKQLTLDANRAAFDEAKNYPLDMFNLRQSAMAGLPYSQTTTGYNQAPGTNSTAQTLGGLASLAGGVGSFFAAPKGGTSAASGIATAWSGRPSWLGGKS